MNNIELLKKFRDDNKNGEYEYEFLGMIDYLIDYVQTPLVTLDNIQELVYEGEEACYALSLDLFTPLNAKLSENRFILNRYSGEIYFMDRSKKHFWTVSDLKRYTMDILVNGVIENDLEWVLKEDKISNEIRDIISYYSNEKIIKYLKEEFPSIKIEDDNGLIRGQHDDGYIMCNRRQIVFFRNNKIDKIRKLFYVLKKII